MTAKDILRKTNRKNYCGGVISGGSILEKSIIEAMNAYTLSIVEKYINVLNLYREYTHLNRCQEYEKAAIVRDKIVKAEQELTRIKNEIGE